MRQSIVTKYIGPTDRRGRRVKARASAGMSLTLSWDDALDADQNHRAAAEALAKRLGWDGRWIAGGLPQAMGGNVYVWDDGDGFTLGPLDVCERCGSGFIRAAGHVCPDTANVRQIMAIDACRAVLEWAKTPGDHGGNPYCKAFVRLARKALGDED